MYNTHQSAKELVAPSKLDHWFMPLAGLGQWRAAGCWIAPDSTAKMQRVGLYSVIEQLLSQTIIDVFVERLGEVIIDSRADSLTVKLGQLANALTMLWWSEEIRLYRENANVFRLARSKRRGS